MSGGVFWVVITGGFSAATVVWAGLFYVIISRGCG
jgi:hypothetical protein